MSLDRIHLELLRALTEHHTLRDAATSINLSPSAASRRLHDAERRVGVALTRSGGRSLELTAAGRFLADAARKADRLLTNAEIDARWLDRAAARPIRLGLSFFDTIGWTIDPSTAVEVFRTTQRGWPGSLTDGTLDLVIDVGDSAPGISRTPLADDRLVAVVPPGHDLVSERRPVDGPDFEAPTYFASAIEPRAGFEFEQLFRPSNSVPANIVRVESAAFALDLVAAGRGVSIQPSLTTAHRSDVTTLELARPITARWFAHHRIAVDESVAALTETIAQRLSSAIANRRQ